MRPKLPMQRSIAGVKRRRVRPIIVVTVGLDMRRF